MESVRVKNYIAPPPLHCLNCCFRRAGTRAFLQRRCSGDFLSIAAQRDATRRMWHDTTRRDVSIAKTASEKKTFPLISAFVFPNDIIPLTVRAIKACWTRYGRGTHRAPTGCTHSECQSDREWSITDISLCTTRTWVIGREEIPTKSKWKRIRVIPPRDDILFIQIVIKFISNRFKIIRN